MKASGGLYVAWNSANLDMEVIAKTDQSICVVVVTKRYAPRLLTIFYASHIYYVRNKMWEDFINANLTNIPWMICGGFNCIININDPGLALNSFSFLKCPTHDA